MQLIMQKTTGIPRNELIKTCDVLDGHFSGHYGTLDPRKERTLLARQLPTSTARNRNYTQMDLIASRKGCSTSCIFRLLLTSELPELLFGGSNIFLCI